ncbi:hypothetical protein B1689_10925, partial [Geobacillus sp. 44C]
LPILPTFFENIVYLWNKMGFRRMSETHFVNSLTAMVSHCRFFMHGSACIFFLPEEILKMDDLASPDGREQLDKKQS